MTSQFRISASPIVCFNLLASVLFAVVAVVSAIIFDDVFRVVIVVVSLALFAVGVAAFLVGFFAAVQRSRESEISVSQLFFLTAETAPRNVKVPMLAALSVQTVVGIAAAIARPTTDGKAGSVLAFGVLVPMLGLGLNGLWASRHGIFGDRGRPAEADNSSADTDE
jgi:hypothetical protein